MGGQIRIGISGWRYPPWRGSFYPSGLTQARELGFASRQFPAIEINGSFYGLQRPSSYAKWAQDTPEGFVFTLKAPRYITHELRLQNAKPAIANFLASGIFALGTQLGPILWQLPPSLTFDQNLIDDFLQLLPHDTESAARLAHAREERMHGRELLEALAPQRIRHALEVRHASFQHPGFIDLLRQHGVALVVADTAGRWPEVGDITADFLYLRLHGAQELYASGYSEEQIGVWARRIRVWSQGGVASDMPTISPAPPPGAADRGVFCFFDNTMKAHAPHNARRLADVLRLDACLHPS